MSVFRAGFLLLLFANLVFFAWTRGYFGDGGGRSQGREPQRLNNQLAADKLRIVVAGKDGGAPTPPVAGQAATLAACRLVTGLAPAEADALKAALATAELSVEVRPAEAAVSYWVHIPPQGSKAAADKKAAELRALGVTDFYVVVDEGPSRYALSLGLFQNEAGAKELLQVLGKRGVRSARIETREKPAQRATATVRGPAAVVGPRLAEQLARLPGASAADCP